MIFNYTASLDATDLQLLRSRWRWLLVAGVAWHLTGFFLTLCGSPAFSDGVAMGGHANEIEMVARPRGQNSGCCARCR